MVDSQTYPQLWNTNAVLKIFKLSMINNECDKNNFDTKQMRHSIIINTKLFSRKLASWWPEPKQWFLHDLTLTSTWVSSNEASSPKAARIGSGKERAGHH